MILRIFIAIIALNALHASNVHVLHPEENDPMLARGMTQNTEQHTSWSVLSVMNSAYHMVTYHKPTPEEVLREQVRNIVFPDGRNAAGKLIDGYEPPPLKEVIVDHNQMLDFLVSMQSKMDRTDDPEVYSKSLKSINDCALRGNKHALSMMAWLFASGNHSSRKILWPHINQERAALFREAANESLSDKKTPEEIRGVLNSISKKSRELSQHQPENKKER